MNKVIRIDTGRIVNGKLEEFSHFIDFSTTKTLEEDIQYLIYHLYNFPYQKLKFAKRVDKRLTY